VVYDPVELDRARKASFPIKAGNVPLYKKPMVLGTVYGRSPGADALGLDPDPERKGYTPAADKLAKIAEIIKE
jgi:hypothetical protein